MALAPSETFPYSWKRCTAAAAGVPAPVCGAILIASAIPAGICTWLPRSRSAPQDGRVKREAIKRFPPYGRWSNPVGHDQHVGGAPGVEERWPRVLVVRNGGLEPVDGQPAP